MLYPVCVLCVYFMLIFVFMISVFCVDISLLHKVPDCNIDLKEEVLPNNKVKFPLQPKDWIDSMKKRKKAMKPKRIRKRKKKAMTKKNASTDNEEKQKEVKTSVDGEDMMGEAEVLYIFFVIMDDIYMCVCIGKRTGCWCDSTW